MGEIDLWSSLCKSINIGGSLIDRIRLALRDGLGYEYTSMRQKANLLRLGLLISCWESIKIISDNKTSQRNCVILRRIRIPVVCPNITSYCSLNGGCVADMILGLYYSRIKYIKLALREVQGLIIHLSVKAFLWALLQWLCIIFLMFQLSIGLLQFYKSVIKCIPCRSAHWNQILQNYQCLKQNIVGGNIHCSNSLKCLRENECTAKIDIFFII